MNTNCGSRRKLLYLTVTPWNAQPAGSTPSSLPRITSARLAGQLPPGQKCLTCNEHHRLQPYCPDCRDRGYPSKSVDGNKSGNAMLEKMRQEQDKLVLELAEADVQEHIKRHTRECPECGMMAFVQEDDYICESCRNAGL